MVSKVTIAKNRLSGVLAVFFYVPSSLSLEIVSLSVLKLAKVLLGLLLIEIVQY